MIEAHDAAAAADEEAEVTAYAEAERDAYFAMLKAQLSDRHRGLEPGPAFSFGADEGRQTPDQVRGDSA